MACLFTCERRDTVLVGHRNNGDFVIAHRICRTWSMAAAVLAVAAAMQWGTITNARADYTVQITSLLNPLTVDYNPTQPGTGTIQFAGLSSIYLTAGIYDIAPDTTSFLVNVYGGLFVQKDYLLRGTTTITPGGRLVFDAGTGSEYSDHGLTSNGGVVTVESGEYTNYGAVSLTNSGIAIAPSARWYPRNNLTFTGTNTLDVQGVFCPVGTVNFDGNTSVTIGENANWTTDSTINISSGISLTCGYRARVTLNDVDFHSSNLTLGFNSYIKCHSFNIDSGGSVKLDHDALMECTGTCSILGQISDISSGGSLYKFGSGTLQLGCGTNNFSGNIYLYEGNLVPLVPGSLGTGKLAFDGGTLLYGGAVDWSSQFAPVQSGDNIKLNTNTFSVSCGSVMSGEGGLVKSGAGTLTLTAANTYTGGTTVNGGTLTLSGGGKIKNALTVNSGAKAIVNVNIGADGGNASSIYLNGGRLDTNASAIDRLDVYMTGGTWAGTGCSMNIARAPTINTYASSTTSVISAPIAINQNGASGSLIANVAEGDADVDLHVSGQISGDAALEKRGTGTMLLTAGNTYSGETIISAGKLQIGNGGTTGSLGAGNVTDNGSLVVNRSDAVTLSQTISGSGSLTQEGNGDTTITSFNAYTGGTTVNHGTLALQGSGKGIGMIRGILTINSGAKVVLQGYDVFGYDSAATGISTININGGTLDTANPYSSNETLTGATVNLTGGTWSASNPNAYFDLFSNGFGNTTVNSLASPIVSVISTRLNLRNADKQTVFTVSSGSTSSGIDLLISGQITQSIAGSTLTKAGAGTMALTATNTYTGGTVIAAGTLQIGDGGTTGSLGTGNVTDNGRLIIDRSNAYTLSQIISGTGSFTQQGNGTTTLTSFNTYIGGTTVNHGVLALQGTGSGTGMIRGVLTINSGAKVVVMGHDVFGFSSADARVSTININGGALDTANLVSNNETLTGVTVNLTGGTWSASNPNAFFDLFSNGFGNTTVNCLASSTTSVISTRLNLRNADKQNLFTVNDGSPSSIVDLLVIGPITEGVAGSCLSKAGTGMMVLAADAQHSGKTLISEGILALAETGQISRSLIENNASLQILAGNHNVLAISGSGTTQVLKGTLSATSIVQDTLVIGASETTKANIHAQPAESPLTVPEPGSAAILLAGLACIVLWRIMPGTFLRIFWPSARTE
jgi:autotransporter-associated beta strand protein